MRSRRDIQMQSMAERIVHLREAAGFSQPELARLAEHFRQENYPEMKPITRNDIANWESEKTQNKRTAMKACDVHILSLALEVDCDYIITGRHKGNGTPQGIKKLRDMAIGSVVEALQETERATRMIINGLEGLAAIDE